MITYGTEFDNFKVEPGMELESFDMNQAEEIFLNHPFKILLYYLRKHLPYGSFFSEVDINDFYFELLDDYNRYGIAFERENNLFPDNCLYVIENDNSKKPDFELHFDSKYVLLFNNNYDKKTLLFNKVKKIDLDKYDEGEKPLSKWEKEKRNCIKEQDNVYLKIAIMDPSFYNDDELFRELIYSELYDYNGDFLSLSSLMFTNKKYEEYFKKKYKEQINMIRRINFLINKGNSDYLGIIEDRPQKFKPIIPQYDFNPDKIIFDEGLFKNNSNILLPTSPINCIIDPPTLPKTYKKMNCL